MLGVLIAAGRLHHPVDRQARGIVGQLVVILVINIVFGFASGGNIDNAAHLGGLAAGLWLGALVPPTRVPTLSSLLQQPPGARTVAGVATAPGYVLYLGIAVVGVVVVAGIAVGTSQRTGAGPDHLAAPAAIVRRQATLPPGGSPVVAISGASVAVAGGAGNGAAIAASSDR
jgi:hypothetical protein